MPPTHGTHPAGGPSVKTNDSAKNRSRSVPFAALLLLPLLIAGIAMASGRGNAEAQGGPIPVITSIVPNSGPSIGGNTVTINGTNFNNAYQVNFGGNLGTNLQVVSDSVITVIVPPGIGNVNVYVTTLNGTSQTSQVARYSYIGSLQPTVTDLDPESGPLAGNTLVAITGTGFLTATSVFFGSLPAAFQVLNDNQMVATAPASLVAGPVYVRVTNPAGTSVQSALNVYTYSDTPIVTDLNPDNGPTSGGTAVSIYGSGFTGTVNVTFGGTNAQNFQVINDNLIIATSPIRPSGAAYVIVHKFEGSSFANEASLFVYTSGKATVTGVSPATGTTGGGTQVTLSGVGFTNATQVTFGGVPGTGLNVVSDTQIKVVTPGHGAGVVDVLVTTAGGVSLPAAGAKFTYNETNLTYTLQFRWNLIVWQGQDGISVTTALQGVGGGSVLGRVTAIYSWNAINQVWRANFPTAGNLPGANDFTTLSKGVAYWMALNAPPPATWTVAQ